MSPHNGQARFVTNRIIKAGIVSILILTPLAFGTTEVWSKVAFQILSFSLLGIWLIGTDFFSGLARISGYWKIFAWVILMIAWGTFQGLNSISIDSHASFTAVKLGMGYLAVGFLVLMTIRTQEDVNRMVMILIFFGFGLCLLAIIQGTTWNGRIYWIRQFDSGGDVFGPYINRNHFSGYIEMLIPLGLGYLLSQFHQIPGRGKTGWNRIISRWTHPEANRLVLIFFCILVMTVTLFLTLSRSGILSLLTALVMIALLLLPRSFRGKTLLPIGLLCLSLISLIWFGMGPVIDRLSTLRNIAEDPSLADRLHVWGDTLEMISDHPISGTGLGTFEIAYPAYKSLPGNLRYIHAHNDYLQLLAESGWVGFIMMMGASILVVSLILRSIFRSQGRWSRGMLIGILGSILTMVIHSLTDFNLHIPANALLMSVIIALSLCIVAMQGASSRKIRVARSIRALALIGIAWLLYSVVSEGFGDYHYRAGIGLEKTGAIRLAALEYKEAIDWTPGVSNYRFALGRTYEQIWVNEDKREFLDLANQAMSSAILLSPRFAEYHLHQGWIFAQSQDQKRATDEFLKLIELDPMNPNWRHYVGLWFSGIGEEARARDQVKALRVLQSEAKALEIEAKL